MKKIIFVSFGLLVLNHLAFAADSEPKKYESSKEVFVRSGGAQAIQEKRFDDAIKILGRLINERKNDPYPYKTKGILLFQQKKLNESKKALRKALQLNPADRQTRWYLAQVSFLEHKKEEAKEHLKFIIDTSEDEPGYYEEKAQRALGVIEAESVKTPKKEKNWKVFGTYGFDYDDNVPLQSQVKGFKSPSDRNANRFTVRNGASYEYLKTADKRAGLSYTFSQSFHTDNVEEFNYRNHVLQKYFSYFTEVFERQMTMGLKYTFSHGTLDNHTFSSSNSLLPWLSFQLFEPVLLSFYDNLSHINFRAKGTDEGNTSREGWYSTTGVMVTFYFSKRKRSLSTSYEFGYNQTEGDNFDVRAHTARVNFKTTLIEKIRGETSFSVLNDNHYNYSSLPHRHNMRYDLSAKLIRPIGKYVETRLIYTFIKVKDFHEGRLGQFVYDRHIVGGEVSFSY